MSTEFIVNADKKKELISAYKNWLGKVLSKYKGVAVHLYSFYIPKYKFKHGHDTRHSLSQYISDKEYANHMSEEHNKQLASYVYHKIVKNA